MFFCAASRADSQPWPVLASRARRQQHRLHHAFRIGDTLAGDVERRAMVDRRPDDRQPQRHVDRLAERRHFDRNQTLIVIAGNHHVELASQRAQEDRVARKRAGHIDARSRAPQHSRFQHVRLFPSKQAVLSRMRVQSGEAIRGRAMPNRGSSRLVNSMIPLTDSTVSAEGTTASGM